MTSTGGSKRRPGACGPSHHEAGEPVFPCDGNGNVVVEGAGVREAKKCSCWPDIQHQARMRSAQTRVPRRLRDRRLSRFPVTVMPDGFQRLGTDFVDDFAEAWEEGRGLWFVGDRGTGKSSLAAAIVNTINLRPVRVGEGRRQHTAVGSMLTLNDLVNRFLQTQGVDAEAEYTHLLRQIVDIDLLVIDDLGAREHMTPWARTTIFDIVDGRSLEQRPTIVTSNEAPRDLDDVIGRSAVDRLEEICGAPILFGGESHRKIAAYAGAGEAELLDGVPRLERDTRLQSPQTA